VLGTAVHLANDLDGLARLVIEGEQEDGRVDDTRCLVIESADFFIWLSRLAQLLSMRTTNFS